MQRYEYKVIATPRKLKRVRGVKGPQALFAHILTETMNEYAVEGWEYVRAESLPVDEKQGMFKGTLETFQSVLVFRRELTATHDAIIPPAEIEEQEHDSLQDPQSDDTVDDAEVSVEDIAPAKIDEYDQSDEAPDPLVKVVDESRQT